jgi:hypothetical protein
LLHRGTETVTVYAEEVTTDADGNTMTRPSAVGVVVRAVVQPMTSTEDASVGFETTSKNRLQSVVLPILREALPGAEIRSWVDDVDHRSYPLVSVRRVGCTRHKTRYNQLGLPVIELAVFSDEGLVEAEELYEEALYAAVREQTQIQGGGRATSTP